MIEVRLNSQLEVESRRVNKNNHGKSKLTPAFIVNADQSGIRLLDTSNESSPSNMLRRKPTRIELKQDDMADFEEVRIKQQQVSANEMRRESARPATAAASPDRNKLTKDERIRGGR